MNKQLKQFSSWYGDGRNGSCPTTSQWSRILSLPNEEPITLINFFKLRVNAIYGDSNLKSEQSVSGRDAFNKYASVSIPTMARVGGKFFHVGTFSGVFLGEEEAWDIVAIGAYPNLASLIALYTDADYRKAFQHRTAACEQQKVLIAGP